MLKKSIKLSFFLPIFISGCYVGGDDEYSNILKQPPQWEKFKDTIFIDSSIDKNKSFVRTKTIVLKPYISENINIYNVDCKNQRVAELYGNYIERQDFKNDTQADSKTISSTGGSSEDFHYNPLEPNSLNKLWQSIDIKNKDSIFVAKCGFKGSEIKPHNPQMKGWTFLPEVSSAMYGSTYVKTSEFKTLKENRSGQITLKKFYPYFQKTLSSEEMKLNVDCNIKQLQLKEVIHRDNDFEYAPAADQKIFRVKKTYNLMNQSFDTSNLGKAISGVMCR